MNQEEFARIHFWLTQAQSVFVTVRAMADVAVDANTPVSYLREKAYTLSKGVTMILYIADRLEEDLPQ